MFMVPGLKSKDPNVDGSKVFGQFLSTHYHKPSDDINQPFNWNAAETFTKVNAQIGWRWAEPEQTKRTSLSGTTAISLETRLASKSIFIKH